MSKFAPISGFPEWLPERRRQTTPLADLSGATLIKRTLALGEKAAHDHRRGPQG